MASRLTSPLSESIWTAPSATSWESPLLNCLDLEGVGLTQRANTSGEKDGILEYERRLDPVYSVSPMARLPDGLLIPMTSPGNEASAIKTRAPPSDAAPRGALRWREGRGGGRWHKRGQRASAVGHISRRLAPSRVLRSLPSKLWAEDRIISLPARRECLTFMPLVKLPEQIRK